MLRLFFQSISVAIFAFALTACTTSQTVRVPRVPIWVPLPVEVHSNQVLGESLRLTGKIPELTDSKFTPVSYAWLYKAIPWAREFSFATGFAYTAESFDCDKFAKAFSLAAEISASRAGVKAQPLVARIYVKQVYSFGGVPAGGYHALNAVVTERGLIVIEPQSGEHVPFERYPNAKYITKILFGG